MISSDDIIERTGTAGRPVDPVSVDRDEEVDGAKLMGSRDSQTVPAAVDQIAPPARKKRKGKRRARAPPNLYADAYSIADFCKQHSISEAFYFQLQTDGLGPRIMKVGGRVLISREAAAAWRRKREAAAARKVARYKRARENPAHIIDN